jgi:hypothetical protein
MRAQMSKRLGDTLSLVLLFVKVTRLSKLIFFGSQRELHPYQSLHFTMLSTTNAQRSPVNVIDIWAVIKLNSKDAGQKLQVLPMESFTASCTDDSGSLSSVSTQPLDDSSHEEEDRRPIFTQYWKKTGEQPIQLKRRHSSRPSSVSIKQQERIDGTPEPSEDAEDNGGDGPERRGERRSIFGNRYARHSSSAGSLPTIPHPTPIMNTRRAKSTSALPDDNPPSCLRRKGDRPARKRSSSVSFDEKVDIVLFQRPQETWSSEGWSKLFAL